MPPPPALPKLYGKDKAEEGFETRSEGSPACSAYASALPERMWGGLRAPTSENTRLIGCTSQAPFPSPLPQSLLRSSTYSPRPPPAPPPRYRLDQQLQVPGLKGVLILRVQVLKLLQEAQVIQLYIWMREKY